MAEAKPRTSLTGSSSRESFKSKNPFSRMMKDEDESKNKTGLSMRKSWSTDSLGLLSNSNRLGKTCVCAPTKHEGSFRCRLHRSSATSQGAATTQLHLPKPLLSSSRLDD
ncbi:hypothetical protein EUTSA_v10006496mg [Eutrema salsugineum]|uniref:Serine-rich protein n=1 Tax=Eutrema salsugineum TaxID=72664 RepID=V4NEC8_EUTSA|nr:uncharacterized protein LOC18020007 [Eutrema salsugineum]ESQ44431.1 hypothetical protein EUTSA_v10006496mg [Eutrema salsugineum]